MHGRWWDPTAVPDAYLGARTQGYAGDDQLAEALKGADVIIIPAGVPRKPGMTRDDLFKASAPFLLLSQSHSMPASLMQA
jgi:hypothetical protein